MQAWYVLPSEALCFFTKLAVGLMLATSTTASSFPVFFFSYSIRWTSFSNLASPFSSCSSSFFPLSSFYFRLELVTAARILYELLLNQAEVPYTHTNQQGCPPSATNQVPIRTSREQKDNKTRKRKVAF